MKSIKAFIARHFSSIEHLIFFISGAVLWEDLKWILRKMDKVV